MRSFLAALVFALGLVACQNPLPTMSPSHPSGGKTLQLAWNLPTGRTLTPTTYPIPTTFEVLLHPVVGADRYQDGLTGQSWSFDDLSAAVYTVSLKGKDAQGGVLVAGTATVDLTWAASVTKTITLRYLTSGTGTGQIHLTLDLDEAPAAVTSVNLTMTDPSGTVSQPVVEGNTLYANTTAPVGNYRLYLVVQTANKTALKMESLVVAQNVDTAVTLTFAAADFNATYVSVTSLTLNKTSGTLGLTTETLTPTLNVGASNTLLTWATTNPDVVVVDATGGVTALALGSATITATSVDNPNVSASCTYTVQGMVGYDANGATSGSVPVDTGPYTLNDSVTVKGNTGPLAKTGFTFTGWNTQADGLGTAYAPGSALTMGSTLPTLYAQWAPVWTVTYHAGTATSGNVPTDTTKYQQNATVTVLTNSGSLAVVGLTFVGWNTLANGLGTPYKPGETLTMGTANVALYAQFAATHNLLYLADDATSGTAPTDATEYSLGASATIVANPGLLLKTGYLFAGWNTQADRLGTTWAPGASLTMASADVSLYPVWVPNNLTFSAEGNDITITGYLVSKPTGALVVPAGVTVLGDWALESCAGMTSLQLPMSLRKVGYSSIWGCTGLTSLIIPSSVSEIDGFALVACNSLTSLTLPPNLARIERYTFSQCAALTSIVIPASVTSIADNSFVGCSSLTSITLPEALESIGAIAFKDCTSLTTLTLLSVVPPSLPVASKLIQNTAVTAIHVPAGSLAAYQADPGWSEYIGLLVSP